MYRFGNELKTIITYKMKFFLSFFLFLAFPVVTMAQFAGIGLQYTDANDIQFATSLSYPYMMPDNKYAGYISGGIEYTGGSSPVAGLNIKPIQLSTAFSKSMFSKSYTLVLSCDAGYLFNFRHGKDGIVITPNLYIDYKSVYIKTGYDFNVTEGEHQFFIRAGLCFGWGTVKSGVRKKISKSSVFK